MYVAVVGRVWPGGTVAVAAASLSPSLHIFYPWFVSSLQQPAAKGGEWVVNKTGWARSSEQTHAKERAPQPDKHMRGSALVLQMH